MKKQLVLSINGNANKIPKGLEINGKFKRLGITNPAVIQDNGIFTLFPRLIYEDEFGVNSAILKYNGRQTDRGLVEIFEDTEDTIFSPGPPHGQRGKEDFRTARVLGENVTHGFLVNHDGTNARTEYLRSEESDLSKWQSFGTLFPNISLAEAIRLSPSENHKRIWTNELSFIKIPNPYLKTKDCSLWPKKVNSNGAEEQYGVIIRLFPDMQIIYIDDFLELANENFWRDTISNLNVHSFLKRKYSWEQSHIGLAGQPELLNEGVITFYHGVNMLPQRIYRLGAALSDPDNPRKIIARTPEPILSPTEPWEKTGKVVSGEIVFPTAHLISPNKKTIGHFYGASDDSIGYISQRVKEDILDKMEKV